MLGCPVRNLSNWHCCVVFVNRDGASGRVEGLNSISANEVLEVLDWVNTSVALLGVHETLVRSHRLRLRSIPFVHYSSS